MPAFFKRPWVLEVFFLLIIVACLAVYFWLKQLAAQLDSPAVEAAIIYQPAPTPGRDLEVLEADAEIRIPPSAREIYGMISGFRELDTWVRLDLPAEDLPQFLENARCTDPLHASDPKKFSPKSRPVDWWQIDQAVVLEECSGLHEYLFQRLYVDRSNPDMLRIYVFSITQSYVDLLTQTPPKE